MATKKKKMTTKRLIKSLEAHKKLLAKVRDGLREIKEEAEDLLETAERGDEELSSAIDALSELV